MRSPSLPRHAGAASVTLRVVHLEDIALSAAHGLLCAGERQRAQGISHRATREQFVRTRALLRLQIGRATGLDPAGIVLVDADGEAPRLAGNRWGLSFSVSHSYDWAAVAVAPFAVGVDIERIDAAHDWSAVADIVFHPDERRRLDLADPAGRTALFFETWTRKEAYLKGIGAGLRLDPSSFSTASPDGAVAGPTAPPGGRWSTLPVEAPVGYAAALAVHGQQPEGAGDRVVRQIELSDLIRHTTSAGVLCAQADTPSRRIVLS